MGCKSYFPSCRTIFDIGGQDTRVINIDENGLIKKFEMNDRCAAGTGRFLEIMAQALGYSIDEFNALEFNLDSSLQISSMCTVFAESEVVSIIASGFKREEIAVAINKAIANRVIGMLNKISVEEDIVFAGGCCANSLLKKIIENRLRKNLIIDSFCPYLGAFGAALYGEQINRVNYNPNPAINVIKANIPDVESCKEGNFVMAIANLLKNYHEEVGIGGSVFVHRHKKYQQICEYPEPIS